MLLECSCELLLNYVAGNITQQLHNRETSTTE